jgi:hypothetical protein
MAEQINLHHHTKSHHFQHKQHTHAPSPPPLKQDGLKSDDESDDSNENEGEDEDESSAGSEIAKPGGGFTAVELNKDYWKRETGLYYTEAVRGRLIDAHTATASVESSILLPPLCNASNIFDGDWTFSPYTTTSHGEVGGYSTCPHTHKDVSQHFSLRDQPLKYSCHNQPYKLAIFQPKHCRL